MVMLPAGKGFCKEWREGCGRNKVQAPTPTPLNTHTTNDLSLHREAYQKQADIIPAKILHQLCLPQVTGSRVSGESEREGEMGRREEREN